MGKKTERCSCDEAIKLRRALREVRSWLRECGAQETDGPFPLAGDEGAALLLDVVKKALR